jgi:alkanesulfonate monooxygenase SsuD/methylene tetrahydromethanopterin reductase-like flavin-dependent oxidoreductase (luciferase family)
VTEKRWALSVPLDGFTLAEHADIAREAERLGYTDAWSLEADGVDCFAPLAVVGMATPARRRDVLLGAVRALATATHSSRRP